MLMLMLMIRISMMMMGEQEDFCEEVEELVSSDS